MGSSVTPRIDVRDYAAIAGLSGARFHPASVVSRQHYQDKPADHNIRDDVDMSADVGKVRLEDPSRDGQGRRPNDRANS